MLTFHVLTQIYFLDVFACWLNGNDIAIEGTWIWPEDGGNFVEDPSQFKNWDTGNESLSIRI